MKKLFALMLALSILCTMCGPALAMTPVPEQGQADMAAGYADSPAGEGTDLPKEALRTDEEPEAPVSVYLSSQEAAIQTAVPAAADTYTQDGSGKNNNFGDKPVMAIRAANYRVAYLKFDLRQVAGTVEQAVLRLYKTRGSGDTVYVAVAQSSDWEELEMTCATKVPWDPDSPVTQAEIPNTNNDYVNIDVTAAFESLPADGFLTLVLYDPEGPENQMEFVSREGAKNQPVLNLDVRYTPRAETLVLEGEQTLLLPQDGTETQQYAAGFTDQYGAPYVPAQVRWALETGEGEPYPDASVDQNGLLSITEKTPAGTAFLCITADGAAHRSPVYILSHQEAAQRAADEFVLEGLDEVMADLVLPAEGAYRTTITWASEDPACIAPDGTVNRPEIAEGDRDVILTATFACGEATATRQFTAHVLRKSTEVMLLPSGALDADGKNQGANTLQGGGGANNVLPGQIMVRYDKYRMGIMKYDLSGLDVERIVRARIEFDGGQKEIKAGNVTRDDWDPATLTYNTANAAPKLLGNEVIGEGSLNSDNYVEIDVTEALKKDYAEDPGRIFSLYIYSALTTETNIRFGAFPRLYIEALYTPEVQSIRLEPLNRNETYMARPLEGPMRAQYIATAIDQCGGLMLDEEIVWSVENRNAAVESRGILGQVDEWPKSDIVVPVGTTGRDIAEVTIYPDTEGGAVKLRAAAKNQPAFSKTLDIEIRDSIPNDRAHPYMMHTKADLPAIRERVKSSVVAEQYSADKTRAKEYTVEELKAENIYQISPWRPLQFNFSVPAGVASAEIGVYLKGKGEVGLDAASLLSITSQTITMNNTSFETGMETPNDWVYDRRSGNGAISYEEVNSGIFRTWSGSRYMKITNENSDDLTGIYYPYVPLEAKNSYTFAINVSQLDKVQNGTFVVVRFKDADGNYMEDEELWSQAFNRITFTKRNAMPGIEYATVYMIEDNLEYAIKAKESLLYFLYDAQWGMQYWINTGTNLDDTYQAVHIGRRLYDWAAFYDRFQDSGVITPEEDNIIRSKMYWIAETMMDTAYYNYTQEHERRHNFNTDRSNGLFAFSVVFPEYARAKYLQEHALGEILWQLKYSVGADGSWPECVRYHAAVLTKLFSSASALEQIDYSTILNGDAYAGLFDDPNNRTEDEKMILHNRYFKNMVKFLIQVQTPRDSVNTSPYNGALYPGIGDTAWGDATGVLPYVILTYKDSLRPDEQELVQEAQYAYIRQNDAGISDYFTDMESVRNVPAKNPRLTSAVMEDMGFVIFRQDYGRKTEDYFIATAGGANLINSHQNNDRGAFSLFIDNTPMALDPGIGAYTDGSGEWYSTSTAHNMVSYHDNSGNELSLDEKPGTIEAFQTTALVDYTKMGVPDNSQVQTHKRNFAFVKGGFDMLLISDSIEMKNPYQSRINFNTMSTGVSLNGNTATAKCYNNKELDITVLEPKNAEFDVLTRGLISGNYPAFGDMSGRQDHLQVKNESDGDYFSVLYPKEAGTKGLSIRTLYQAGSGAAYEIRNREGDAVVAAVNNSVSEPAAVTWKAAEAYRALIPAEQDAEPQLLTPENGSVTLTLPPASIQVLATEALEEPRPSSMTVEGPVQLEIPTGGAKNNEQYFEAVIFDQYGHLYEGAAASYSVSGAGVSVNADTGLVTVTDQAKAGSKIQITAQYGDINGSVQAKLTAASPVLKSVEAVGSRTLAIPEHGSSTMQYTARVLDDYGTEVKGQTILWGVPNGVPRGVSFDTSNGTVKVDAAAEPGASFVVKLMVEKSPALFQVFTVTLAAEEWSVGAVKVTGPAQLARGKSGAYQAVVRNQHGQTMDGQPVEWTAAGAPGISVTADGKVSVSAETARGTVFQVTAAHRASGCADSFPVTVTGGSDGGSGGSGMSGGGGGGGGSLTPVEPFPTEKPGEPGTQTGMFRDLDGYDWAREAVESLGRDGIINGKAEGIFAPEEEVTREEFVKMLMGVFAVPVQAAAAEFADADSQAWYYPYVATASVLGIIEGYSDSQFGVGDPITRQDIAVICARMLESRGLTLERVRNYTGFGDSGDIADYAREAVAQLYQGGIINGRSETEFAPASHAGRAEAAVMLYRIAQAVSAK